MTDQSFETMRQAMVSNQLRTTAVNDPRVVEVLRTVPREAFVPADRAAVAYVDIAVPLVDGRALNQPMATGRLITELATRPGDRALIVGAATGYSAAILSGLVAEVVALEENAALLDHLRGAGLPANVTVVEGAMAQGWADGAPYDVILVDGAVEHIPQGLIDQLADGGRVAAAVLERGVSRLSIGRKAGTAFGLVAFADADAVPLPGFAQPAGFRF